MAITARPTPLGRILIYAFASLILTCLLLVGGASGCKAWGRYQKRADANNNVKVTSIQIRNQAQRVKIAKQKAQIREETAIGIRKAQDHIAATLTPAYIQWEAIQAQLAMANARNNSVIYIPTGANGVPLVSVTGKPQVLGGEGK